MRYLLDTHTFLWAIDEDQLLSDNANEIIMDKRNDLFLSIASIWEIAIKVSLEKLDITFSFENQIEEILSEYRIDVMSIAISHTKQIIRLPFHHKDPFDRIIVAQSLVEGMALVSNDKVLDAYDINRLW